MKLSDKALRLIGLHLLERMDDKTHQDDSKPDCNTPQATPECGSKCTHRLNSRAGPVPCKAPVLRFPVKDSKNES
jgi:hypothetical protein